MGLAQKYERIDYFAKCGGSYMFFVYIYSRNKCAENILKKKLLYRNDTDNQGTHATYHAHEKESERKREMRVLPIWNEPTFQNHGSYVYR